MCSQVHKLKTTMYSLGYTQTAHHEDVRASNETATPLRGNDLRRRDEDFSYSVTVDFFTKMSLLFPKLKTDRLGTIQRDILLCWYDNFSKIKICTLY
jgi:hypothetical protein